MTKVKCSNCAHHEYLHEYEMHMCNAQDHPIRDEFIDEEDECDFYEEYKERNYILFSEEELTDLGKGNIIEHPLPSGEVLYFMCAERYAEMMEENK